MSKKVPINSLAANFDELFNAFREKASHFHLSRIAGKSY